MEVEVYGMGYVGIVCAVYLESIGNTVYCHETNSERVEQLKNKKVPFFEPKLSKALSMANDITFFDSTRNDNPKVFPLISIVCVGTPLTDGQALNTSEVIRVCESITKKFFENSKGNRSQHIILIRSTMPPGAVSKLNSRIQNKIAEEYGDKKKTLTIALMPEFLREGSALSDIINPSIAVCGIDTSEHAILQSNDKDSEQILKSQRDLIVKTNSAIMNLWGEAYKKIMIVYDTYEVVEIVKLACNAWHATKIVFANEIGRFCESYDCDSKEVMSLLTQDTRLNISKMYMEPGFAYGGSCLPKDTAQIVQRCVAAKVEVPLLKSLSDSNNEHVLFTHRKILNIAVAERYTDILILGIAFKAYTSDMRNSAPQELVNELISSIYTVKSEHNLALNISIYDPHVSVDIKPCKTITEVSDLFGLTGTVIVVTQWHALYTQVLNAVKSDCVVLDLFNMYKEENTVGLSQSDNVRYSGLTW